jgi:hypothetical protein
MIGFVINMIAVWFNVMMFAFAGTAAVVVIPCIMLNIVIGMFCLSMDF